MALRMPDSDVVNSVGYVDEVVSRGDSIEIRGWVASSGPVPIDRLSVELDGDAQTEVEVVFGMPSEDVAAVHPRLCQSDRARYSIKLHGALSPPAGTQDRLIVVTPWAECRVARSLYHVFAPTIPEPPQKYLDLVGGGVGVGYEFLAHLIGLADVRPDETVLDVGCGTGRIAYALRCYLAEGGRYEGFDIVRDLVDWASREITTQAPAFRFVHADIANQFYNPDGPIAPADYRFPYSDGEFDVVFLTSVFTHMRQPEIEQYLDEIWRVLRPGGRCFATCFLLDDESGPLQAAGKGVFRLEHPVGGGWSSSSETPELAMGFAADDFLHWVTDSGFKLRHAYPGWWSGRFPYLTYQDVLIFDRP